MCGLAEQGTVLLAEYTAPYRAQIRAERQFSASLRARLLADIARADASRAKSRIAMLGGRSFVARGTKLFPAEVELICGQWGSLEEFFDQPRLRLIRLRRLDIVAQAVSQFIAQQTGAWFAYAGSQPDAAALDYDDATLRRCLAQLREGEASLDRLLAGSGDRLAEINYEQLVREPEQTLRALAAHCGHALDPTLVIERSELFHKQASGTNAAFAERLRRELAAEQREPSGP